MNNLLGQSLGRYHIIEQLGQGGMAVVYKAYDTRLEREVAVKIIRRELFGSAIIERILNRFEREAKAMARLSHPNIVKVLDFGEHDGSPFLVMELLSGGTLKNLLDSPMPYAQAASLLEPIARGLSYAHSQHILHRDVKPSNIVITHEGIPVLTDFGIAKILDVDEGHTLTGTGIGVGTPEYMAPEQGLGQEADERADIYSLGIVFYELITGHKPYTADTPLAVLLKQVNDPLPSPSIYMHDLPESVEKVIYKALAKKPQDRYQNMSELAEALSRLEQPSSPVYQQDQKHFSPPEPDSLITIDQMESDLAENNPKNSFRERSFSELKSTKKTSLVKVLGFSLLGIALAALIFGAVFGWFNPKAAPDPILAATDTLPSTNESTTASLPAGTSIPPTPAADYGIGSTMVSEKDGMTMAYVPAGSFLMGSPYGEGDDDEHPQHEVYLDAFWIDKTEVTNAMFQTFVKATGYQTYAEKVGYSFHFVGANPVKTYKADWLHILGPASSIDNLENHPVVHVTWNDAATYCSWAGKRLPTEAEWEKVSRGVEGYRYPWGNTLSCEMGNFDDETSIDSLVINYSNCDGYPRTAPVGSFINGSNSYGALDLSGNVWEWISDWYLKDYYSMTPFENPNGPAEGDGKVVRGGSWYADKDFLRSSFRNTEDINFSVDTIGFRCVLPIQNQDAISISTLTQTPTIPIVEITPSPTNTFITNQIFVTLVNNGELEYEYHIPNGYSTEESGTIPPHKSITVQLLKGTYYWVGIYKLESTGGPEFQYQIEKNSNTTYYRFAFP